MRGSYFMHSNKKIGHLPHGKQLKRLMICIFVLWLCSASILRHYLKACSNIKLEHEFLLKSYW